MRYLITGHTGFKGSWLAALLAARGDSVSGVALDPPPGGIFERARIAELLDKDMRVDIRDASALRAAVAGASPDVVVHLAAQPLVRASYANPRETYEVNVGGTFNLLEAVGASPGVKAAVIITTDKVYRNVTQLEGYVESDPLGGDDPYSSSKAMADLLTQSYVRSFPGCPTAIARAGNVIGGGDVSPDRLLVDLLDGFKANAPVPIRMPDAVRPWQHVLDCVSGYLALVDHLLLDGVPGEPDAWNFGPDHGRAQSVRELADCAASLWGAGASWMDESHGSHPHEAALLTLDSSKASRVLHWANMLPYPKSVAWTVEWERAVWDGADASLVTNAQISRFVELSRGRKWLEGH